MAVAEVPRTVVYTINLEPVLTLLLRNYTIFVLMYIIADSGSTKCEWIFVNSDGCRVVRTDGINAMLHTHEQICDVLRMLPQGGTPSAIYFYGAGCGAQFPQATHELINILIAYFGTRNVEINSDLMAAARALLGRGKGIACILGTGSNSCLYDGVQIVQNIPPLGYILGDEGSGAVLGRKLIGDIFKGLSPLRDVFLAESGLTYEQIIRCVYREPSANRFLAGFVPFIKRHIDNEGVHNMVMTAFSEFAERNLMCYPNGYKVSFVGGVAANFRDELSEVMAKYDFEVGTIIQSPAEGLIKYHNGE